MKDRFEGQHRQDCGLRIPEVTPTQAMLFRIPPGLDRVLGNPDRQAPALDQGVGIRLPVADALAGFGGLGDGGGWHCGRRLRRRRRRRRGRRRRDRGARTFGAGRPLLGPYQPAHRICRGLGGQRGAGVLGHDPVGQQTGDDCFPRLSFRHPRPLLVWGCTMPRSIRLNRMYATTPLCHTDGLTTRCSRPPCGVQDRAFFAFWNLYRTPISVALAKAARRRLDASRSAATVKAMPLTKRSGMTLLLTMSCPWLVGRERAIIVETRNPIGEVSDGSADQRTGFSPLA